MAIIQPGPLVSSTGWRSGQGLTDPGERAALLNRPTAGAVELIGVATGAGVGASGTLGALPGAPLVTVGTETATAIPLTITPGSGATSHSVYASTTTPFTPGAESLIASGLSGVLAEYTITGRSPETTYYVVVRAINATGHTDSSQATAVTEAVGVENWNMDEHLPSGAGLTLRDDTSWPVTNPSPWGEIVGQGPGQSIITDATAPTGGTTVMRQFWEGVADGFSPRFSFLGLQNTQHVFGSVVMRLDPEFDVPSEVKGITIGGGGFIWWGLYRGGATYGVQGAPTSQLNIRYVQRGPPEGDRVSRYGAQNDLPVPKGQWFKFSFEVKQTVPVQSRAWINSTLIIDMGADGMLVNPGGVPSGDPVALAVDGITLEEMQQHSTWGGGNGFAAPSTIVIDHARTAIWRLE